MASASKVQPTRLQYAAWLGTTWALVMVANNDVYVRNSPLVESDRRITTTGAPELFYNGVSDWLYQGTGF